MIIGVLLVLVPLCSSYEYQCDLPDWKKQPRVYINEREVLAPTHHGFSVFVDSTDQVVSKNILDGGSWDLWVLTLLSAFVKKGDNVLNLGAQTGLQATLMAKIVGPTGSVTVFEPFSVSYKIVTKNLEINGAADYSTVYKYGVGEKEETLALYINDFNTGMTGFINDGNTRGTPEDVEVKTVDSVIGDKKFDFILMDVEMFELQAINGMRKLLKRSPAIVFLLEWKYLSNPYRNEARTKELLDWLAGEGFTWYRYFRNQYHCKLGTIEPMSIPQVLQVREEDLLLVGKEGNLSRFK